MKKIFGVLLLLLMIFVGLFGWKEYVKYNMDKEMHIELIVSGQTQYICDAVKLVEALQNKNIVVDQEYINEIRKKEQFIIGNFQSISTPLDIDILGAILYLNEYYEEGMTEKILTQLEKYYIEDSKLLSILPQVNNENDNQEKKQLENILFTRTFLSNLGDKKEVVSKYKLEEGLAEWFNINVKNTNDEEVKSTLEDVFWYFYDENLLHMIKYKEIKDIVKEDVDIAKKYVEDEETINLTKVMCLEEVDCYMRLFENDNSYQGMSKKIFSKIETLEQLEYSKTDKACLFFLTDVLQMMDSEDNFNYLKEVINACLKENLYECCKEDE